MGIDRNLNNITVAETNGNTIIHDLRKATKVKNEIRQIKRRFKRNDDRVRRKICAKYGRLEKDRVGWILHNTSASIVKHAQQNHQAIAMENLKGIRKLYRKGNRQGGDYRANELVELLRATAPDRIQGLMARHTRNLRERKRDISEVFNMWKQNDSRREPTATLPLQQA